MRLPGQKVWTPATCLDSAGPRSFLVKSGSTVYRRNRRDIIKTSETPVSSQTVVPKETPLPSSSGKVSPGHYRVRSIDFGLLYAVCGAAILPARCAANRPSKITERKKTPGKISPLCVDVTRSPARFCDCVLTFIFCGTVTFVFFLYIYKREGVTNARRHFDYSLNCLTYARIIMAV